MSKDVNKIYRISIRSKLLLVSAVLFTVPWIGVQYIQDMENFLRISQEESLLGKAQIVAAVLQGQAEIFKSRTHTGVDNEAAKKTPENLSHLYVRPLKRAIQLDGYLDDWLDFDEKSKLIKSENSASIQYRYYLASYRKYLYMILKVKDDKVVYRKANSLSLNKNDHIIINLRNKEGQLKNYIIATQSPGWVNAHRMEFRHDEWQGVAPELRIKGEWQETVDGYNVEVRLPLALIGDDFSFFVADVDDAKKGGINSVLGESEVAGEPGTIVIPSLKVEEMLRRINRPASRTWVVDQNYRVLAVAGDIRTEDKALEEVSDNGVSTISKLVSIFYHLLLKQPTHNFKDELSSVSYLRGKVVTSALEGIAATSWRDTPDKQVKILTASYPVMVNGKSVGAIAIEETSNSILILQNRAMEILINLTALTFLITVVVLLSFATRLSVRIRRLRDETERAITSEGKIEKSFKLTRSSDEIGDLTRSFTEMLSRLAEYNRYLETMAGKLSHELRTPVTVARSSLENLQTAKTDEARETYIRRASEGMGRLSDILTRMSEATRLEQTLQSETLQNVDLSELIENCIAGYRIAYPDVEFKFEHKSDTHGEISAVPELLAQMLDKLVSNAVDFHVESTAVELRLKELKNVVQLSVINLGDVLPESMRENLFESMVSVRNKRGDRPHLGLGLYIVRMIVEFHQGSVRALNLDDESGVEILIELPLG